MRVKLTIAVDGSIILRFCLFFVPQHSKDMIIRDSSFHHRGSKDPQGISQGRLQQVLFQVKQPVVVAKQVENSVDTLVRSIFLLGFFCSPLLCSAIMEIQVISLQR